MSLITKFFNTCHNFALYKRDIRSVKRWSLCKQYIPLIVCFFHPWERAHFPFNNLGLRAIIIRLHGGTTFPRSRRVLLITKVRSEYDAIRCAGITTNEVLNLNKLQGTRLPSAFSIRLSFAPSAVYPLSVASEFSCEFCGGTCSRYLGRASRTRNGDMNIPGVEYPRAVNLFGTTRMKKVRLEDRATLYFPVRDANLRRARALVGKILRLNKRQRSSPSGFYTLRSYVQETS